MGSKDEEVGLELYKKYRPKTFKEVVGQDEAVHQLQEMIENERLPRSLLFTGPSGCGKTTLARILVSELKVGSIDCQEINCADFRGIDMVRDIRSRMNLAPISGNYRIYLIDEGHKLTSDSQTAFLKILEDTPRHVFFFLCTTNPESLLPTILTRATEIQVTSLSDELMTKLVIDVVQKETDDYPPDEVIERLVEIAEGSPRKALVLLHQIIGLKKVDEQLRALNASDHAITANNLVKMLVDPKTKWSEIAKVVKESKDITKNLESLRQGILGYATSILLNNGKLSGRAYLIIQIFRDNWFACGKAGLVASLFEVFSNKE